MSSKKPKDNNDLQFFREQMHDVTPIDSDRVEHPVKKPKTRQAKQTHEKKVNDELLFSTEHVPECDVILGFERPGLQKPLLKKFRQGKMQIEASLDLHGYTAEQARTAMIGFMQQCHQEQVKIACIVHGKGFGSNGKQPVIKPLINKWLRELPEVLAFSSAQPKDGGTGAVYVMLRKDK